MKNLKIIVFGDIHGRPCWKEVVHKYSADLYIFLGDYFTSRDGYDVQAQIDNWNEILDFKKQNPNKVILLRGNHCMEALKYSWARCYPVFYSDHFRIQENKKEYLDNTQWCYVINNIIFSHAGISQTWYNEVQKQHPEVKCFDDINKLEPSELFAFTPEYRWDDYGDSKTQPLTWIRPTTLIEDAIPNTINVVGHTRNGVNRIINYSTVNENKTGNEFSQFLSSVVIGPEINSSNIFTTDTLPDSCLQITIDDERIATFENIYLL